MSKHLKVVAALMVLVALAGWIRSSVSAQSAQKVICADSNQIDGVDQLQRLLEAMLAKGNTRFITVGTAICGW